LLEFFFAGGRVMRFLRTGNDIKGRLLKTPIGELERLFRSFRLNLNAAEQATTEQREQLSTQARVILSRLYDILYEELAEELAFCQSLVIVPHGFLHYLPFHALFDGQQHLIERFALSYSPSSSLYDICCERQRGLRYGRPVIMANSAGGELPFAIGEARSIATVLDTQPYLEAAATRTVLETEGRNADFIHIAAHGRFRQDAPLFSAIDLADGPLTTADVFGLELKARLVALSACETGRAVVGGGDELIGLTRAFLYAGAASLLVSQWRVDDASTARLMEDFYSELAKGKAPAIALRSAQVAFLHSFTTQTALRHPFYWAGFQIIGDGLSQDPQVGTRRRSVNDG
jgi:CHAT domain-containing protein